MWGRKECSFFHKFMARGLPLCWSGPVQEGDGFKIAMAALDGGRINIGACRWAALPHALGPAGLEV